MSENNTFDWSRFTIKTPIKSDVKSIYNAWTTPAGLESWFLRSAEFKDASGKTRDKKEHIHILDTYKWLWHGYPDSVMEEGEILEINGKDHLKFSFGEAGIVSINILEDNGKTIVKLDQEDIPHYSTTKENYHVGCKTGWTFYLVNLNSILQGGLDLRNKDVQSFMD
ncbi:SRPBCC family protein [Echinicola salinicaeni]|uniref:SRPBCC family protein n=1 Tax=Echinicola salinicaeni TaxID=2762757 RepID=UPI00164752CB|nr:SRPBCC domain-containing protein [Echinicola salinicaeni]